jgi:hypothetical protein
MGKLAETLVWERSRAGKSDLLMLVKIADGADDEGRNAWMEVPRLMKYCRASERAAQNTLCRLVDSGEIEIEYNDEGREIVLRGGRRFRPKWFIHVRCVCAWDEYQQEVTESAEPADLRRGRPKRKPAGSAVSRAIENRRNRRDNPQDRVEKTAETGSAYKEGSLSDLVVEQEQGAARPPDHSNGRRTDDDPHYPVILKTAHDAIDLDGVTASLGQLAATTKSLCRIRRLSFGDNSDVIAKAVDAALFQRTHPRGAH